MKKFQFAMGALALGLLASCSSDAPDAPNRQGDDAEEGYTYVAMRIAMDNMTRADANALTGESTIKGISMYIIDPSATGAAQTVRRMTTTDISNGIAYFKVTNLTYTALEDYQTKPVILKVYANLGANGLSLADTWEAQQKTNAVSWTSGQFLMAGETGEMFLSKVNYADTNDHTKKESAWILNGGGEGAHTDVSLTRLASRFDLEEKSENFGWTYTAANNLKITIVGMDVRTHETETFWFKQNDEWITPNCEVNDPEDNPLLNAHTYTFLRPATETTTAKLNNYARPHIVSDEIKDDEITYGAASYVAVKAQFEHEMLNKDANKNATHVYSMNGQLLGSYEYIKSLKGTTDAQTKTNVEAAYTDDAVRASIITLLGDLSNFTEETLSSNSGPHKQYNQYTKVDGKWYTYYNAMLKMDKDAGIKTDNLDIERNKIYKISVDSFKGLGFGGTEKPQDPDENTELLYLNLKINVENWTTNDANTGLKF